MSGSASATAGAKAGVIAGVVVALLVGAVNIAVMLAFKSSVLQALPSYSACTGAAGPDMCFAKLLNAIPFVVAFPLWVAGSAFGVMYGVYFEFIPGRSYYVRAMGIGTAMLIAELAIGLRGIAIVASQAVPLLFTQFLATIAYSVLVARYYRRYTREVRFDSADPKKLRLSVDGKDLTGKVRTLTFHSAHKVSAPAEGPRFHAWLVSGGVSVADSKSPKTTIKVEGDGLLKIS